MHLSGHEGHELGKVDRVVSVSIDLTVSTILDKYVDRIDELSDEGRGD